MNNELILYSKGEIAVPRQERGVAARAKRIYDETRLHAMKADATLALAGHMMEGLTELDGLRKRLSKDDMGLAMTLGEIEAMAVHQLQKVQSDLHNHWSF